MSIQQLCGFEAKPEVEAAETVHQLQIVVFVTDHPAHLVALLHLQEIVDDDSDDDFDAMSMDEEDEDDVIEVEDEDDDDAPKQKPAKRAKPSPAAAAAAGTAKGKAGAAAGKASSAGGAAKGRAKKPERPAMVIEKNSQGTAEKKRKLPGSMVSRLCQLTAPTYQQLWPALAATISSTVWWRGTLCQICQSSSTAARELETAGLATCVWEGSWNKEVK